MVKKIHCVILRSHRSDLFTLLLCTFTVFTRHLEPCVCINHAHVGIINFDFMKQTLVNFFNVKSISHKYNLMKKILKRTASIVLY